MDKMKSPCANCGEDIAWFPLPADTQTCGQCSTSYTRDQILNMWYESSELEFSRISDTLSFDTDQLYIYRAEVTRVIDGDTFEAAVELGFNVTVNVTFRLLAFDTPEPTWRAENSAEEAHGVMASRFVRTLLTDREVILLTRKNGSGKYGRWLADIVIGGSEGNWVKLTDLLAQLNLAKFASYAAYAGETFDIER
tara:strand:+ start:125799 stop:126383 length:585 start_codon:yes stop_codon:yes gene_type:complete